MPYSFIVYRTWTWLADTGINLAILLMLALLVPRAGRFAERIVARSVTQTQDEDESKASLAIAGVGIYVVQFIAYFLLVAAFLQQLGLSLAGAAIPATVISAAVGFGSQSIIADFLAGFFVISEKQYGVGDWVRFQGNGVEVEGTVISLTMRATTIRTLAQETVTIPNSTARVSINTSNYWSRAVVVMPIPLLGSHSVRHAVERAEAAAHQALLDPERASELREELVVQPATSVKPPTTVGVPWTVDMRFMIQVNPGSQWEVERAIRLALLEEFWDEYASATTISGEVRDTLHTPSETFPTTGLDATRLTSAHPVTSHASSLEPGHSAASTPANLPAPDAPLGSHDLPQPESTDDDPVTEDFQSLPQRISYSLRETRTSTWWMLAVLVVLIVLRGTVISTEGADGEPITGIFAPRSFEQSTQVTTTESTASQTGSANEPAESMAVTPSAEPAPTSAVDRAPADSTPTRAGRPHPVTTTADALPSVPATAADRTTIDIPTTPPAEPTMADRAEGAAAPDYAQ